MNSYLMLLYSDRTGPPPDYSSEQMQAVVHEYWSWMQEKAAAGQMVDGHKLTADGGRVLNHPQGTVAVTDGPYAETKEVLGGLFVIRAGSYDEAVKIAQTCPHVKYGAKTVVRQIDAKNDTD